MGSRNVLPLAPALLAAVAALAFAGEMSGQTDRAALAAGRSAQAPPGDADRL